MDYFYESYVSFEPEDIPKTKDDVWILAKKYSAIQELDIIRRDVETRLWFTYRRGFSPIGSPQLSSDVGWGCMLRCGQMVLAEALINLHLGRDWFWTRETKDPTYLKILHRFEDNAKSPFSIHQIALMGDSEDKKVGEWFGPNTIAQVLKKIVKYDDFCSIVIHVALDSTIATDEVYELCETITETESLWSPLLLIIPLRLGLSEINPIYIEALKKCFQLPGSCGMIGGRPNQALYFIGFVGDEALYLDPHTLQRAGCVGGKLESYEIELDETYHQKYANRINFKSMDPSLALCFLCRTKTEFVELLGNFNREIIDKPDIQSLFEIITKRSVPWFSPPGSGSSSAMRSSVDQDQFVDCENLLEGEEEINKQIENSDDEFEIII